MVFSVLTMCWKNAHRNMKLHTASPKLTSFGKLRSIAFRRYMALTLLRADGRGQFFGDHLLDYLLTLRKTLT